MIRVVLSSGTTWERSTPDADSRQLHSPGPAVRRMLAEPNLRRAFDQLHACGPRPVAMFVAELIDATNNDAKTLDRAFTWRAGIAPDVVFAIGGEWLPMCLHAVQPAT